MKSVVSI